MNDYYLQNRLANNYRKTRAPAVFDQLADRLAPIVRGYASRYLPGAPVESVVAASLARLRQFLESGRPLQSPAAYSIQVARLLLQ